MVSICFSSLECVTCVQLETGTFESISWINDQRALTFELNIHQRIKAFNCKKLSIQLKKKKDRWACWGPCGFFWSIWPTYTRWKIAKIPFTFIIVRQFDAITSKYMEANVGVGFSGYNDEWEHFTRKWNINYGQLLLLICSY